MQIETNIDYPFPAETCHAVLRDEILPDFSISYWVGYNYFAVPVGSINLKVIEEDYRASVIKVRTRYGVFPIPQTLGPVLKIYSRSTGETRCTVEMVAESTDSHASEIMKFFFNLNNYVNPGMFLYKFRASPKIFFDSEVVYDYQNFSKTWAASEFNVRAYKYIFSSLHNKLGGKLNPAAE